MLNPYKDFSNVDPQPGTPHRRIERVLFHALMAAGLSGVEYQLVFTVIDKTWGFRKTCDVIPLSQFEEATGLERRNIHHYLNRLEERHILIINRSGPGRGRGNTYMLNKYWDTWILDKVLPIHQLVLNGVEETPFSEPGKPVEELVSPEHLLSPNSVPATPLGNSVPATPIPVGNSVNPAGNGVSHEEGNSVAGTPSIERKKVSIESTSSKKKKDEGTKTPATYGAATKASEYLFEKTSRKRWANLVQKELFERTEAEVGFPIMKEAIDWALIKGISHIQSMITTAKKKAKEKEKSSAEEKEKGVGYGAGRQPPGRGTGAHREDPLKTTRERGWETGDDEGDEDGA